MAERLRRLTRNQIPSGSVGSNPTDCEYFYFLHAFELYWVRKLSVHLNFTDRKDYFMHCLFFTSFVDPVSIDLAVPDPDPH